MLVAVWAVAPLFAILPPEDGVASRQGIVGGGQVCAVYHGQALGVWPHVVGCPTAYVDKHRHGAVIILR